MAKKKTTKKVTKKPASALAEEEDGSQACDEEAGRQEEQQALTPAGRLSYRRERPARHAGGGPAYCLRTTVCTRTCRDPTR